MFVVNPGEKLTHASHYEVHQTFKQSSEESWLKKAAKEAFTSDSQVFAIHFFSGEEKTANLQKLLDNRSLKNLIEMNDDEDIGGFLQGIFMKFTMNFGRWSYILSSNTASLRRS